MVRKLLHRKKTKTLEFSFFVSFLTVIQVPNFGSGLGTEVLDIEGNLDDQCSITFGWISNEVDGVPFEVTVNVVPKERNCNKDDFEEKVAGNFFMHNAASEQRIFTTIPRKKLRNLFSHSFWALIFAVSLGFGYLCS